MPLGQGDGKPVIVCIMYVNRVSIQCAVHQETLYPSGQKATGNPQHSRRALRTAHPASAVIVCGVTIHVSVSVSLSTQAKTESMHLAHELQTKVRHIARLRADEEMKENNKYDSDSDDSGGDSDYCEEEDYWGKEWSGIALKTG